MIAKLHSLSCNLYSASFIKATITILTVLISVFCRAQTNSPEGDARLLETIPFKIHIGGVITMEARLGSDTTMLNFILDSGSGGISLDSSTCSDLNLPVQPSDTTVSGIAGVRKVPFVFDQKFITGDLVSEDMDFYVNDYTLLSTIYGEKIDGIIGYGFLRRYILNINFDSGHIQIYSPGKFRYLKGGTLLRPSFSRLAALNVTVKDNVKTEFNFYLDTGAGLSLLMTEKFIREKNMILRRRKPVLTQAEGLGGKKDMLLTVIKSLRIGPYIFRNVPTHLFNDENNVTSYPYTGGLIGNDIMRRFNITLNYPKKEISIIPNSNFNDRFDYAYTGMSLFFLEGRIYIDDIISGSPAEKAALKGGDEIISVSEVAFGNIQEYKNLLQKAKGPVKMIIKRDSALLFISLQPISIL